jgi:uncharacterized repeat protein (TIGR01451 family)
MMTRALVLAVCAAVAPTATAADLVLPSGGRVAIELFTSDASFHNTLALVSPSATPVITGCRLEPADGLPGLHLLSEKISQHGCRVELDADPVAPGIQGFAAGTTLRFALCAQANSDPACEFVWSSNAASNSDGFEHLRTTPIHPAEFPGQIFQLAWEDQENGGDMDFNDLVAVVRIEADSDGDGLWDDWEQFGIDTDGDGTVDLTLPGANPLHKDIFVEADFMDCAVAGGDCAAGDLHSHRPRQAAIDAVVQAFRNAPVTNPDGQPGIELHVDLNNAVAHQNVLSLPGTSCPQGGVGSFDAVKADPTNFGPSNPRRFAYHYALFAHQEAAGNTTSGCGELPGNDFMVSLGGWNFVCSGGPNNGQCCGPSCFRPASCGAGNSCVPAGDQDGDGLADGDVGSVQQQAGTFMHELGHNLNLQHGGGDGTNNKPNYISVMNYSFQFGIQPTDPDGMGPLTGRTDYSGATLGSLVETGLSESAGIGDGTDSTFFFCPGGGGMLAPGTGPIDWNCDGDCTPVRPCEASVAADINRDATQSMLNGFDDWQSLRYDFQGTNSFDDGFHPDSPPEPEVDFRMFTEMLAPELTIAKTASPGLVPSGANVTYTVSIGNTGPSAATGVRMTDDLPTEVTFVSCAATGGGVCDGIGNTRTVDFHSFSGGVVATVTLVARVPCDVADGTVLANSASLSSLSVEQDPSNDSATAVLSVSNPPFQRIDCHLDELTELVRTAPGLGSSRLNLLAQLRGAQDRKQFAEHLAAAGNIAEAKQRLGHAIRRMINFNHRMEDLRSRHTIPNTSRGAILAMSEPILDDMRALLDSL